MGAKTRTRARKAGTPARKLLEQVIGELEACRKLLREAGATLRDMIRERTADEWGVDAEAVETGLENRFGAIHTLLAQAVDQVDEHDAVVHHDADNDDDTNEGEEVGRQAEVARVGQQRDERNLTPAFAKRAGLDQEKVGFSDFTKSGFWNVDRF